jgi:hypothetical protein
MNISKIFRMLLGGKRKTYNLFDKILGIKKNRPKRYNNLKHKLVKRILIARVEYCMMF